MSLVDSIHLIEAYPEEAKHHGHLCYPIIKRFLDSGLREGQINMPAIGTRMDRLYPALILYLKRAKGKWPVRACRRNNELYLIRTDLEETNAPGTSDSRGT